MSTLESKFIIKQKNKVIYQTTETQGLYLYPLTLKDYVDNIKSTIPIKIDIIKTDSTIDYKKLLNNKYFNNLLCIEFHLEDKKDISVIKDIINIKDNTRISLTIKNINDISKKELKELSRRVNYFKLYWNYQKYEKFLERLEIINKYKKEDCLVHIKSYLSLEEINNYEKYIKDFDKYKVNIYQLSKELIPLDKDNIKVDKKIENVIRKLERKYSKDGIKFISVKNLKELYYPRFELDERNSRNCFACHLKPYLYKDIIIPCKVNEKINNIEDWGTNDLNDFSKFKKCGLKCDDCASIYENDKLNEIHNIIKVYKSVETIMEEER